MSFLTREEFDAEMADLARSARSVGDLSLALDATVQRAGIAGLLLGQREPEAMDEKRWAIICCPDCLRHMCRGHVAKEAIELLGAAYARETERGKFSRP